MTTPHALFMTLLFAGSMLGTGCSRSNNEPQAQTPAPKDARPQRVALSRESLRAIGVRTSAAVLQPLTTAIVMPGKFTANQDLEAHVGSFVQGRVSRVLVQLGARVRRGQVLMEIEGVEIGEIKSRFIKARAQLTFADASLKRQQALRAQNIGSQRSLLEAEAEFEKTRAEFTAEDKRIHSIGLSDEDVMKFVETESSGPNASHAAGTLPIRSPIDGILVERNVVIGQVVDQSTLAFKVLNTSMLWADGQAHEGDIDVLRGSPDVTVTAAALPGEKFSGRITYVGEQLDARTRTVTVRAEVDNRLKKLKPEMFCEIHLSMRGKRSGIVAAGEGLIKDGDEHYVFIAVNDTTFEKRVVTRGASSGAGVEITAGVEAGEKIVTQGAFMLKSELKKSLFGEE